MPGLDFSNELISLDEVLYTDFAGLTYTKYQRQVNTERVYMMNRDSVEIGCWSDPDPVVLPTTPLGPTTRTSVLKVTLVTQTRFLVRVMRALVGVVSSADLWAAHCANGGMKAVVLKFNQVSNEKVWSTILHFSPPNAESDCCNKKIL
eukprot:95914_1